MAHPQSSIGTTHPDPYPHEILEHLGAIIVNTKNASLAARDNASRPAEPLRGHPVRSPPTHTPPPGSPSSSLQLSASTWADKAEPLRPAPTLDLTKYPPLH